ncbi:YeeE/YedE thiosulfate transporter family protein [Moorella sp. Hama-1]|uniref:YeeE/YedE thiosulfate transporter family protein n=1 Tax=Moorella sp. Hama-1 TaxID=2138101 RepID=UPI00137B0099|nr:YeeE/YedE thiosulfate transporter family protein [Moorella sp. Hama-1]BCV22577.1 hypothetical protein hamaS1_26460 [Moorella sp. Hama-1]
MSTKWSWVQGGIILGLWNLLIFLSGNHLGTTTAYAQTAGYITQFFSPQLIPVSTWTAGTCGTSGGLMVSWQWMLVLGAFIGGLAGRLLHREGPAPEVPELWQRRFGDRPRLRFGHAFLGGFLLLFGARIAGGCTSSHIISGMSQMAISGVLFALAVFAAGIPMATFLYRRADL